MLDWHIQMGHFPFWWSQQPWGCSSELAGTLMTVEYFHTKKKLMYSSPLGLTCCHLDVAFLPFGSIMGEDRELM
jgi:hypothetical protein